MYFNYRKPDYIVQEYTEPKYKLELKNIKKGSLGNKSA
jgi:hypothetical protein